MSHVNHFIAVPSDLNAELEAYARQRGMSLSDILIESLVKNAEEHRIAGWKMKPTSVRMITAPALRYA